MLRRLSGKAGAFMWSAVGPIVCRSRLLLLAAAVLFVGSVEAALYVNSSGTTTANVTVAVGETVSVTLLNSSSSSYFSTTYTLSLDPSSSAYYTATLASSSLPKSSSTTLSIKGLKGTASAQKLTVTGSTYGSSSVVTINITVTAPAVGETFDFDGCSVAVTNATVGYVSGEPVLTFKSAGTLSISGDMEAEILVVGGGGSGAAGRKGKSNWYGGAGGSGGNGSVKSYEMPQGAYAIVVGTGGANVANSSSSSNTMAGNAGGPSSIALTSGTGSFATVIGTGGAGGVNTEYKNKNSESGASGDCPESDVAGGTGKKYGNGGAGCTYVKGNAVTGAAGADGTGDGGGGGAYGGSSGAGGSGIVIVRLKGALASRVPIAVPTAAAGLVYDGTVQTGVAAGSHYTLGGTFAALAAGAYVATATPSDGYCWPDGSSGKKTIDWSIARRPVTVSVLATNKVEGAEEPVYPTKTEGFVSGDNAEASWKVWRTNLVVQTDGSLVPNEAVGTYDLVVSGTVQTPNYAITYVNGVGAFEIRPAVIEIAVPTAATGFIYDGKAKTGVANGTGYALSGTVTATDAGEYVATATLLEGYCWAGGSTAAQAISWSISKAAVAPVGEEPGAGSVPAGGVSSFDVTATYDGEGHTINANALAGAVSSPRQKDGSLRVEYACGEAGVRALPANAPDGLSWTDEAPAFTDAGEYVVWYRITADNYETFVHAAQVTVSPLAITVTPVAGQEKTVATDYTILFTTNVALVGTDCITGALAPEAESVGMQRIVLGTLAIDDGNGGENYVLTFDETVTINVKSPPPSISEDEGQIDYDPATKEVVVRPGDGVTEVEIANMPDDATAEVPASVDTVRGVTSNQVVVVAEATNETGTVKVDITDAFKIAETPSGVTIELNDDPAAEVVVEIGGTKETVKVTPEPLVVVDEDVTLGVKTIPGLTYELKRLTELGGAAETVAREKAKGTRLKLTDPLEGEKPDRAFYVIEVTK